MKTSLLLITLLLSNITHAHQFHHRTDNFWRNFDRQFQMLDRMSALRKSQFQSQSRRYFDSKNNSYVIKIHSTAFDKNDIKIEQQDQVLIVQGNKKDSGKNHYNNSSFYNAFTLPDDADSDNIDAKFEKDTLTITIKKLKTPTKPKAKTINIQ